MQQGRVRCGACYLAFDALAGLSDETIVQPVLLSAEPPAPVEPDTFPPPPADLPLAPIAPIEAHEPAEPVARIAPMAAMLPPPAAVPADAASAADGAAFTAATAPAEAPTIDADAADADDAPQTPPLPAASAEPSAHLPVTRWPWRWAALPLLLLAMAQLVFIYRVEIAVLAPAFRPWLQSACAQLDCPLPHPRRPELIGIETSDLVPAEADRLHLTALLRNRAPFVQEYPHLELALTDLHDKVVIRRAIAPAEYLPPGTTATSGFPRRDELAVSLWLATPGIEPVGYRLYLFYP